MSTSTPPPALPALPALPATLHHIGYVVEEVVAAAARLAALGAGPFLHLGHVTLDYATYDGGRAVYDHETAFGQWGPLIVEISRVHAADPPGLREFLTSRPAPHIGHAAWLVDDLDAESARLEALGMPLVHTGSAGPVAAHWHDGAAFTGHPVEVLRRCPEILHLYSAVHDASIGWDGSDPLRPFTPPAPPTP